MWSKNKFGKKSLEKYTNDILSTLKDQNILEAGDDAILVAPRFIGVEKKRINQFLCNASLEICEISIVMGDSHSPITSRNWLSISFEGNEADIEESLRLSTEFNSDLWACYNLCNTLYHSDKLTASQKSFFPIISGYPEWIYALYNPLHLNSPEYIISRDLIMTFLDNFFEK